jgi:4'-phosphopantetheinyl transferase
LAERDLHLWLCPRDRLSSSDEFKRCVLARYAGVAPSDLQFVLNDHGKPTLVAAAHTLDFNLSHSGDWLACAVTAGTPVGVDLEFCDPRRASMKVARRFFRKEEVAVLEACSEVQWADRFFDFWTLKESAIKARGEALAPGLASYGFELTFPAGEEGESGRIAATAPDVVNTALYGLLEPLPDYRLALCWLPERQQLPRLGIFELREGGAVTERVVPLRASSSPG